MARGDQGDQWARDWVSRESGVPGCAGESFLAWACTPGAAGWARLVGQAGWARPVGQGWVGKAGWSMLGGEGWVTPAYTLLLCCAAQGCLQFFFCHKISLCTGFHYIPYR